jgi:hypothetical protein
MTWFMMMRMVMFMLRVLKTSPKLSANWLLPLTAGTAYRKVWILVLNKHPITTLEISPFLAQLTLSK